MVRWNALTLSYVHKKIIRSSMLPALCGSFPTCLLRHPLFLNSVAWPLLNSLSSLFALITTVPKTFNRSLVSSPRPSYPPPRQGDLRMCPNKECNVPVVRTACEDLTTHHGQCPTCSYRATPSDVRLQ